MNATLSYGNRVMASKTDYKPTSHLSKHNII